MLRSRALLASWAIANVMCLIVWAPLLCHPGFVMHGDITFPMHIKNYIANNYPMWDQYPSFSNLDEVDRLGIMLPVLWFVKLSGMGIDWYSKLFLFTLAVIAANSAVVSFWWLRTMIGNDANKSETLTSVFLVAICVATFVFNPWALYQISAPFFYLAYAIEPLVIVTTIAVVRYDPRWAGLLAVFVTLASASPQYTLFTVITVAVVAIVTAAYTKAQLGRLGAGIALFTLTYAGLNWYWIYTAYAIARVESIAPGYPLRWSDVELFTRQSGFLSVLGGIDEWVQWWRWNNPFAGGFIGAFSDACRIIATLTAFALGVYAAVQRRWLAGLPVGIVLLLVVVMGAKSPVAQLYHWFMLRGLPGVGWIIRAPTKFDAFLWTALSFALLVGLIRLRGTVPARIFLALLSALAFIEFAGLFPVLYGTLWSHYLPVARPKNYAELWRYLSDAHGRALSLGDYEDQSRFVSGDAIFTWAPNHFAGSVVPRSLPIPTYSAYHFADPFAYTYGLVKKLGPERLKESAFLLGTNYVLLENDVAGDSNWYNTWYRAAVASGGRPVLRNRDFALVRFDEVSPYEVRSGSYVAILGPLDQTLRLLPEARWTGLQQNNALMLEQRLPGDFSVALNARALVLNGRPLSDVVLDTLPKSAYRALLARASSTSIMGGWEPLFLSNQFETPSQWVNWKRSLGSDGSWNFDFGYGVAATQKLGATMRFSVAKTDRDIALYMRYFAFPGSHAPAFDVVCPGHSGFRMVLPRHGITNRFVWGRMCTVPSGAEGRVYITLIRGAGAVNVVAQAAPDLLSHRLAELRAHFRGKIVQNVSSTFRGRDRQRRDLKPLSGVVLASPGVLNETWDPLWFCESAKGTLWSKPAWGFANGFFNAPSRYPCRIGYVLQDAVVDGFSQQRWILVAVITLLALMHGISRYLSRKGFDEAS